MKPSVLGLLVWAFIATSVSCAQGPPGFFMDYNNGNVITAADAAGFTIPANPGLNTGQRYLSQMAFDQYANNTGCTMYLGFYCVNWSTMEYGVISTDSCGPGE